MSPPSRVDLRMRALTQARDCAALGARVRTIHHLTGIPPKELLRLLFTAQRQPPRGRPPDTREWYHNANVLYRVEASIVVSNFQRLRQMGFPATDALIAAYRYYQSVYHPPCRISFDRAFDLAAHTESLWIARSASFHVSLCNRCGSEFLDAIGADPDAARPCPFCRLLDRHARDPRLTAGQQVTGPETRDAALAWVRRMERICADHRESFPLSGQLPVARS